MVGARETPEEGEERGDLAVGFINKQLLVMELKQLNTLVT